MKEPIWVRPEAVTFLHARSLARYGGSAGIRDQGLLASALARPQHLFTYGQPTIFALAASYAFGLVKNHPYLDGNKRAGFVVAIAFLEANAYRFSGSEIEAVQRTIALATGEINEDAFANWLAANSQPQATLN